mgnify:CR=1 FL=1
MSRKDLVAEYAHIDRGAMLPRVLSYFDDLRDASASYSALSLEVSVPEPMKGLVVSGMGGSFIGALFLQDLLHDRWRVPILALREMSLPAFVDEHYLVIAVSYSGNTEETIRVVAEARRRRAPTIVVTSGGLLGESSSKLGYQVVKLPPGLPPRAAFPFMLPALAALLDSIDPSLGLVKTIAESASSLKGSIDSLQRAAVELSEWMLSNYSAGRLPVVYAYRPYYSAGYRFKTQINENAKLHAFFSEIPESNHNEIMGWETPSNLFAVVIRSPSEVPELLHRLEFLVDLWSRLGIAFREVKPLGKNRVQELLSLFFVFDLASVLLAVKRGVDPTPVETISKLKKYLDGHVNLRELLVA